MVQIKEDFLQYVWRTQNFKRASLVTTKGDEITIHQPGVLNQHEGPDFLNGKIEIKGTLWAGSIELHVQSSDWTKHNHSKDPKYQNVILHVVYEEDKVIRLSDGTRIPCLELKKLLIPGSIKNYNFLKSHEAWIPCQEHFGEVSQIYKETVKAQMVSQRLDIRARELRVHYNSVQEDLRELIYQRSAWAFGLQLNGNAMLELAKSIPFEIIDRHSKDIRDLEALFFGQSGLLPGKTTEGYVHQLKTVYERLRKKYLLHPINPVLWHHARLRPVSFPEIRIAQFAHFLFKNHRIEHIIFGEFTETINERLDVVADGQGFWQGHYRFNSKSNLLEKRLGTDSKERIGINCISPILYFFGVLEGNDLFKQKAIEVLEKVKPEKNSIISEWKRMGMNVMNAADSQALIHLKKHYCDNRRCLNCSIGHQVMILDP